MNKKIIYCLLILIIPLFLSAQAVIKGLSLKEAQEYALKNNMTIKNAVIDLEIAKKKIWETTAMGLPQLNAVANYSHIFKVPEVSFPGTILSSTRNGSTLYGLPVAGDSLFVNNYAAPPIKLGVSDNLTFDITLSQLVFNGAYLVGLQASKVFYQISEQALEKNEIDIRESVANTYLLVLNLIKNEEILSNRIINLEKTLNEMRQLNKAGFLEITDVDQLELTILSVKNAQNTLQRQIDGATDLLKFQIGMPYEIELELSDDLDKILNSAVIESITGRNLEVEDNIVTKILNTQVKIGELNLKREKSGYLPSLAAFYKHSEKARQADFDFFMKDMAGVQLNIPIFSSGQRKSAVAQRKLELLKMQNSRAQALNGLQLEFKSANNDFSTSLEKYNNEKRNIELAERIYDKTLIKFKEGLSSSMDITTAQNQLLGAQSNYFTAIYSLLVAKNKIDKLTNNQ
jgi:outer membrane protein